MGTYGVLFAIIPNFGTWPLPTIGCLRALRSSPGQASVGREIAGADRSAMSVAMPVPDYPRWFDGQRGGGRNRSLPNTKRHYSGCRPGHACWSSWTTAAGATRRWCTQRFPPRPGGDIHFKTVKWRYQNVRLRLPARNPEPSSRHTGRCVAAGGRPWGKPLHCTASIKAQLTGRRSPGRALRWSSCARARPIRRWSYFQTAERMTRNRNVREHRNRFPPRQKP